MKRAYVAQERHDHWAHDAYDREGGPMTTWAEKLKHQLKSNGESWSDVEQVSIAKLKDGHDRFDNWEYAARAATYTVEVVVGGEAARAALEAVEFDDGFGGAEGQPFTMWTANNVYFPTEYDGAEGVNSVPRNPCGIAKRHA